MNEEAHNTVLRMKYARIIEQISQMLDVSVEQAMSIFYESETMELIDQGVADLHCRSDRYLAGEVIAEWEEGCQKNDQ